MRKTGRSRARVARLVRGTVLSLLTTVTWAGLLADPATSPAALAAQVRPLTLHDELSWALAERSVHLGAAASRSAPPAPEVVWPVSGALTGWFGERRGDHRHPGIDVDNDTGAAVVAAAAGNVVSAGPAPAGYSGYGTMVLLAHGDGLTSIYAHLSRVTVRSGQQVTPGQLIGAVGTTGNVTGSHLHFELRRRGVAVDPKAWLPRR